MPTAMHVLILLRVAAPPKSCGLWSGRSPSHPVDGA